MLKDGEGKELAPGSEISVNQFDGVKISMSPAPPSVRVSPASSSVTTSVAVAPRTATRSSHRVPGSIGLRPSPGKVWKNKADGPVIWVMCA